MIKNIIELYDMNCSIEEQDIVIQEEIKKIRSDLEIPLETGTNFWKLIDENKYNLKNEILKLYSMFGTNYNCKAAFSNLKIIVNKLRNKLSDRHTADLMRIKEYKRDINLNELADH